MKDQIHISARKMIEDKWSYSLNKAIETTATNFINESFGISDEKK
jgi:hypothetical protein